MTDNHWPYNFIYILKQIHLITFPSMPSIPKYIESIECFCSEDKNAIALMIRSEDTQYLANNASAMIPKLFQPIEHLWLQLENRMETVRL